MLFARARRRLTVLYVTLFGLAIALFSVVFFAAIAVVLEPDFDITPELSGEQAAQLAYRATVAQLGIALVLADLVAIGLVGALASILATRTLAPIRVANDRQRRFVADASHEMRSPIAAIRTTSDVALGSGMDADGLRASMAQIGMAAERLSRLAADLLLLARSDDAALASHREQFDLSVTVAEAVRLRSTAEGDNGRIALTLVPDATVMGDPSELARIVDNLVDNGLRYGGAGAHVRVVTRKTEREAVLEVADNGPGIPLADRERIFQPFHRLHAAADAPSGTGLGLAIAASLARRNRGRLTLESPPEGGSLFRLSLPRVR